MAMQSRALASGPRWWPIWLAWTVFVVYGSLVPLDFHPLPWPAAWQRLLDAPMLKLGVESRADWIANGVLYLPVGFLSTGVFIGRNASAGRKWVSGILGMGFGWALAIGVELAQTAFPPRTVSLNDLLAEAIGTALGMVAAIGGAARFQALLAGYGRGGWTLLARLAPWYAFAFPAMALFPFDLLVSQQEWQAKLYGPQLGLWMAGSSLGLSTFKLLVKLAVETAVVMPLGAIWWNWHQKSMPVGGGHPLRLTKALLVGAGLGLLIEVAQLALASGQSQGASVLTRSIGFAAGAAAWQSHAAVGTEVLRAWLRRVTLPALGLNLLLLVLFNNVGRGPWLSTAEIEYRLRSEVHYLPFYYHYFTTEMHAVTSLVAVMLSYAPLGVLGWAWHVQKGMVATMALLMSGLMELSKLLALPLHPDPTNVLIAGAAAWVAQSLTQRLFLSAPIPHHGDHRLWP